MPQHPLRLAVVLLLAAPAALPAQVNSMRVSDQFVEPLFAASAPGDPNRLYVLQRQGQIRILDTTSGSVTPFMDLTTITGANLVSGGGEQGLLGLAFHPEFNAAAGNANRGLFYVNYTAASGGTVSRVERYRYDFTSQTVVTTGPDRHTVVQFNRPAGNHNGGWMGFHPTSSLLYVSTGDSGGGDDPGNLAQNTNVLQGKMLRLNVNGDQFPADPLRNYTIPATNPFATSGGAPEIFSYGLRNPWRSSFDRTTGNMFIADVGQNAWEEINYIANGAAGGQNFGWRPLEGNHDNPNVADPPPPGAIPPIHEYDHSQGVSITGGYVFRGPTIMDGSVPLDGTYFFADFQSANIWSFRYDGTTMTNFVNRTSQLRTAFGGGTISLISSFAEDGNGNLYLIDYGGEIFRVIAAVPEPSSLALAGLAGVAWWQVRRRRRSQQSAKTE